MTGRMARSVVIPGAIPAYHPETGERLFERVGSGKRTRPAWHMPKPLRKVRHFKNAACRNLYESGVLRYEDATHEFPVYRGYDIRLVRDAKSAKRRNRVKPYLLKGANLPWPSPKKKSA